MKRSFGFFLLLFAGLSLGVFAQNKPYTVVFYNLENLFDTIKSPNTYDEEFTPKGSNAWTGEKYKHKLKNIEQVFYTIAGENKSYTTLIGVSEIENRSVLEDVATMPKLKKANYQIAHFDSPDARGVDVALFYRPDQFQYVSSEAVPVRLASDAHWKTRDILMVHGTIEGEPFFVFVNHWPSRRGGQQASEHLRMLAAGVLRHKVDSIQEVMPQAKIIIMGDLNDDPIDKSIANTLGAKNNIKKLSKTDLFNPYFDMFKKGYGTLAYQDSWNLFDNIIINANLANKLTGNIGIYQAPGNDYYGQIFDRTFLRQKEGQYKNYPYRTYVGGSFMGGYSDHFPVYIYLSK
jgi:hypothetical protein